MRTRVRSAGWSIVTQAAIKIKATGEEFRVAMDGSSYLNTITGANNAVYSSCGSSCHKITLTDTFPVSSITFSISSYYGITFKVFGCQTHFENSVGMCGDWNTGGFRFQDGTAADTTTLSLLAQDWKVPSEVLGVTSTLLDPPSNVCSPFSTCGGPGELPCDAINRRLQAPTCPRTCDEVVIPQFREQCELDVSLSGDASWACNPGYINPILVANRQIPGSGGYYVDWRDERCYQECDVGIAASCGGPANSWKTVYPDAVSCCQAHLPYKNLGWCKETSRGNDYPGSGQFYVDNKKW